VGPFKQYQNSAGGDVTKERLQEIELELQLIKQRNAKVEENKAWEVSSVRIGAICATTYLVAAVLLAVIGAERCWLGASVPVMGFFLSTQSLPILKRWWIKSRYSPKNQQ
jgi:hypothetical protein